MELKLIVLNMKLKLIVLNMKLKLISCDQQNLEEEDGEFIQSP